MENALQVTESNPTPLAREEATRETRPRGRIIETRPRLDVLESGEAVRVLIDVPGVDAAHAEVEVELPELRVRCTRPGATTIRYAVTLTLPQTIDAESLVAELRNGVLDISMRKSAQARARRIQVSPS